MDCQQKRGLPPLEQDEGSVFFALDMVCYVAAEDPVLKEHVYLIGRRQDSPRPVQHPPMKGVLEQTSIEKEKGEPTTGAENCDQIRHVSYRTL